MDCNIKFTQTNKLLTQMSTALILFKPTRSFRLMFTFNSDFIPRRLVMCNFYNEVHAIETFFSYVNTTFLGTHATLSIISCNEYNAK